MQLSPHFTLAEFIKSDTARRIRNDNMPTPAHLINLRRTAQRMEQVRWVLKDHPIHVNSAYRNPVVNRAVGGVANSDHAQGNAVDFECPSFGDPYKVTLALSQSNLIFDQLIHERKESGSWWTHISFAPRLRQQLLTFNGDGYIAGIHPVSFGR